MHAIQETLGSAEDLSDDKLVETVLQSWKVVCDENKNQMLLVTNAQWNQWESYRDATLSRLKKAVDDYKENSLTASGRAVFTSVAQEIVRAGHKSMPELIAQAQANMEKTLVQDMEKTPEVKVEPEQKRKLKWLDAIKNMFGR